MESIFDLPNLPLTGIYSKTGQDPAFPFHDQGLLVCCKCGHGQLRYFLDGGSLYNDTYGFRTSTSSTASGGSRFFAEFLGKVFRERKFKRILEFGCNDVYLLNLISNRADRLLGVDPILKGREAEFRTEKIEIIGDRVEAVDFQGTLGGIPDLILSQHTMEHIENPKEVIAKLFEIASDDTTFVMEFPCFDPLLANYRFDQIFHQHLQYFSVQSFLTLLEQVGGDLIDFEFNHLYWGAILIAFRKKRQNQPGKQTDLGLLPIKTISSIRERFDLFRNSMKIASAMIDQSKHDTNYGYGAALMLPILGYHLGNDFSGFKAILDDDPYKNGLGYINLPASISLPTDVDYANSTFVLTAMDSRRPILRNLVEKRPKRIINPLGLI